ncbi:hypothetical protein HELRODRAFT_77178, partial [Helobdella robusta]|uniref:Uncharacterized protein n=1 Tax=Helobdella robusta TaxID=6412 RepID=T1G2U1_HELRO
KQLLPLLAFVGAACTGGASFVIYSLYQKPDVRLVKSSELPPWERVDPTKPQKLFTINGKYVPIPELEALKKEIGSYKT